jgi:hypothetical protein
MTSGRSIWLGSQHARLHCAWILSLVSSWGWNCDSWSFWLVLWELDLEREQITLSNTKTATLIVTIFHGFESFRGRSLALHYCWIGQCQNGHILLDPNSKTILDVAELCSNWPTVNWPFLSFWFRQFTLLAHILGYQTPVWMLWI